MNCQILQQAIAQNQQLAESIQQQLDQIIEAGQASKNQLQQLENSLAEALTQSEQALTNFVPDFKEAFNLLDTYKYSDKIKGFNNNAYTTLQLADGRVLAAGENGETCLLQPQPDGSYKYSDDPIEGFSINNINTTLLLPNGNILVAGSEGETRLLQPQPDGSYKYSDKIEGFRYKNNYNYNRIDTTLLLPNGNILAAGYKGETRLLQPRFVRQAQDIRDRAEEILG